MIATLSLGEPVWGRCAGTIKALNDPETGEERVGLDPTKPLRIAGIANAAIVDRVNEMLDPRGALLANYLKNPKILADHDYTKDIGLATVVEPREEGLYFEADIGYPDLAPLTDVQIENRSLIAQGIRRTVSVGFIPLEMSPPEFDDAGKLVKPAIYTQWELLEISVVSVPCNADSIFQLKELSMSSKRAAGALPMTPKTGPAPSPSGDGVGADQEPVQGTAGDYLKAIHEGVGHCKEYAVKTHEHVAALHEKMDSLHSKVDALKPDAESDHEEPDEDDKDVTQTPSGTDGKPEPTKALEGRIAKLEENIGKLADGFKVLADAVVAQKTAGRL